MQTKFSSIIVLMFSLLTFDLASQTIVPGGNVNGTWSLAGSPYLIQGPIQITDGSLLVIEPGVTVNFQGPYKLLVLGRILAIGNENDTITFTSDDIVAGWRGIRFDNTPVTNDTSKIIYCKLQYGNTTGAASDIHGGALFINSFSKVIISNCLITNNTAAFYCGGCGGGIYCDNSSPVIKHNKITSNSASPICYGSGGGIYCSGTSYPIISNNVVTNNTASYGGGIFCINATIDNNEISNNSCDYNGAGICLFGMGNATITNNLISGNFAFGWYGGGGIYSEGNNARIAGNTIISNTSSATGGGGIFCMGNLVIFGNTISNNIASANNSGGGGIYTMSGNAEISNNTITNNYAINGGGIYGAGYNGKVVNTVLANNDAINGGGLFCSSESNPVLQNCIFWGNTSAGAGAQLFLFDEPSDPDFYYCNVQGGIAEFNTGGNFYTGTYSNNIESDPSFVSPSAGSGATFNGYEADWSLPENSPCIEAGDPLSICNVTDINGNPRVSGCWIDIGPYEVQVSGSLHLEITCVNESGYWACDGSASAIVTEGVAPYSYEWSTGSGASSITDLCGAIYTVTVTDASGCIRNGQVTIYNTLGVEDHNEIIKIFRLYPNPAADYFTVSTENKIIKGSTLTIYNSLGGKVMTETLQKGQHRINSAVLKNGLYIVTLESMGLIEQQKLIINR